MIAATRTKEGSIDPFFLQILCSHVEKQIPRKQNPGTSLIQVDPSYLGGEKGIQAITRKFYLDAIRRLPRGKLRRWARRLCEVGLLTGDGRRRSMLKEDLEQQFKLRPEALETLEALRLLRKEPRHGSFYYEISHDRLAEAVREERRWRLPREVKIGLIMFIALLLVATGLFLQTERLLFEKQQRAEAEQQRAEAEQLLKFITSDLRDKLISLGRRELLDKVQEKVDAYYERKGTVGETDEVLLRKAVAFFDNKGDLLFNRGNMTLALTFYQEALKI
jgi:hypothetical protein